MLCIMVKIKIKMAQNEVLGNVQFGITNIIHNIRDFNKTCRLCLSENGVSVPIFHIEEKKDDNMSLQCRIKISGAVEVEENDDLPHCICLVCYEQVDRSFFFREQCKRSEITLKQYLIDQSRISSTLETPKENLQEGSNLKDEELPWQMLDPFEDSSTSDSICGVAVDTASLNTTPNYVTIDQIEFAVKDTSFASKPKSETISDEKRCDSTQDENVEQNESKKLEPKMEGESDKSSIKKIKRTYFGCDQCPKVCNSHSSLHYHKLKHSGKKPHQCSFCPKTFHQKCTLVKHERVHTGERPYTCDKCGKSFSQESNLKFHMTSHTGEKIFCCHVCGKGFTLGHNLKEHLKIHNGSRERVFSCETCDKSFFHRSHLQNHIRSHTGDKPFRCDTCGKTFIKHSYLKQHNRVHTGERPYKCNICSKAFANSSNLTAHIRSHTGENKYVCKVCDKRFTHKNKMVTHINTYHQSNHNNVISNTVSMDLAGTGTGAIHFPMHFSTYSPFVS